MADPRNFYTAGLSHVGSYQVAGRPFLTGSDSLNAGEQDQIKFYNVTRI